MVMLDKVAGNICGACGHLQQVRSCATWLLRSGYPQRLNYANPPRQGEVRSYTQTRNEDT